MCLWVRALLHRHCALSRQQKSKIRLRSGRRAVQGRAAAASALCCPALVASTAPTTWPCAAAAYSICRGKSEAKHTRWVVEGAESGSTHDGSSCEASGDVNCRGSHPVPLADCHVTPPRMSASSCCRSAREGPCDWLLSTALQFKLPNNARGEGTMRASVRQPLQTGEGGGGGCSWGGGGCRAPDFNRDAQQMLLLVPAVLCAPRLQLQLS
jgi:hypothetical protein